MKENTVAKLRKSGFSVKVHHERRSQYVEKTNEGFEVKTTMLPMSIIREGRLNGTHKLLAKGGKTSVYVTDPNGQQFSAETNCSNKENYCYKRGLDVCLGRIEKFMNG